MSNNRRKHSTEFKAKVALAAIREQKTIAELCSEYGLHSRMIQRWKAHAISNMAAVFGSQSCRELNEQELSKLHAKIGELVLERDFLKKY